MHILISHFYSINHSKMLKVANQTKYGRFPTVLKFHKIDTYNQNNKDIY